VARRVSVPQADDLFRRTREAPVRVVPDAPAAPSGKKKPSGRVKHDEKMTVYVTSEELLELEHARLTMRSQHGLVVDRGRLVREALHIVLADLAEKGEDSLLVQRLTEDE
jgi:hypothetical protein